MLAHIGTCGIGLGHASRSMALARALTSRGWTVQVSTYGEAMSYVRQSGFRTLSVPPVSYGAFKEGRASIKLTIYRNAFLPLTVLRQVACEAGYIDGVRPDVVIADTRASTVLAAKALGFRTVLILNQFNVRLPRWAHQKHAILSEMVEASLDLLPRIWAKSDRILIADFPPPYTISLGNLRIPAEHASRCLLVGPFLERKPSEMPQADRIKHRYGVDASEKVVLAHLSGPKVEKEALERVIREMLQSLSQKYHVILTLGNPDDHTEIRKKRLSIFGWVPDSYEVMAIADAIVCRAGHTTLSKALSLGKPMVCIPTPGQSEQLGNAERVQEVGAAIMLEQEDLSETTLTWSIEEVLSSGKYKNMAEEYRNTVESLDGLQKALQILTELTYT
ncbi:MAG: glycosyltransferase [Nitrososphaeria archaeon]